MVMVSCQVKEGDVKTFRLLFVLLVLPTSVSDSCTPNTKNDTSGVLKCKIASDKLDSTDFDKIFVTCENITDFLQTVRALNATFCWPTSDKFKNSITWKLYENEYEVTNDFVRYNAKYTEHSASCRWNESFGIYQLGEFAWNFVDNSIFAIIPECIAPAVYELDTVVASSCMISIISLTIAIILELFLHASVFDRRPIICHMASLMTCDAGVVIRYFTSKPDHGIACYAVSYGLIYGGYAAISWMTVIVFDMWRHLHKDRIMTADLHGSNKKFICQSLFGWSVAAIFLIVTYSLKYLEGNADEDMCLWPDNYNQIQEMELFLSAELMVGVNFVLFVMIVINVRGYSSEMTEVTRKKHDQLWRFFLKLMVVTGSSWLLVLPSWALRESIVINKYYYVVSNASIYLQGFFLFLVYNFQLSVWKKLYDKIKRGLVKFV